MAQDQVTATTPEPRCPDVEVELIGRDGNAFAILGTVARALREAGATQQEVDEFHTEATAGDYDALLTTVMRWVVVV
jgi:hypothetical protein